MSDIAKETLHLLAVLPKQFGHYGDQLTPEEGNLLAYAAACVRFVEAINRGEIGVAHEAHMLGDDLAVQVYLCADESRYAYAPDAIAAYRNLLDAARAAATTNTEDTSNAK